MKKAIGNTYGRLRRAGRRLGSRAGTTKKRAFHATNEMVCDVERAIAEAGHRGHARGTNRRLAPQLDSDIRSVVPWWQRGR